MSSNKKRFSLGLAVGLSLALAGGAAFAGSIADTYTTGDTLTAAKMTAIKTAVNDNDTRITAIGAGTQTCLTGMTRVGPTCVDTVRSAAATWNAAVNACRGANKRLLTPGEYMAAKNQAGVALGMNTNNDFEWVDAVSSSHTANNTIPGAGAGRLMVGYMGPATAAVIGSGADGDLFFGTNADYDVDYGIFYRCAR